MKIYIVNICNSYEEWNIEKVFSDFEKTKKFCIDYVQNGQDYLARSEKEEYTKEFESTTDYCDLHIDELLSVDLYDVE